MKVVGIIELKVKRVRHTRNFIFKKIVSYFHQIAGETFIPATQRPDGTWRKARRVKEGYVPQEEQPKYKCPAAVEVEKEATPPSGPRYPVGWSPMELKQMAENAKKNKTDQIRLPVAAAMTSNAPVTPEDHINKKILNLKKKVNEIDKLQVNFSCFCY